MTNAATELADLFDSWAVRRNSSPYNSRVESAKEKGSAFDAEAMRGMELLVEIRGTLRTLRENGTKVDHFRNALPTWVESLLSVNIPWNQGHAQAKKIISAESNALLRSLGGYIDLARQVATLAPADLELALSRIADAERFVNEAPDINESTRLHMLGQLQAIREALQKGETAKAASNLTEFVGQTTILSEVVKQSDPGRGDKWAQMGRDLVTNFVSGAALLAIQATALTPPPM